MPTTLMSAVFAWRLLASRCEHSTSNDRDSIDFELEAPNGAEMLPQLRCAGCGLQGYSTESK